MRTNVALSQALREQNRVADQKREAERASEWQRGAAARMRLQRLQEAAQRTPAEKALHMVRSKLLARSYGASGKMQDRCAGQPWGAVMVSSVCAAAADVAGVLCRAR